MSETGRRARQRTTSALKRSGTVDPVKRAGPRPVGGEPTWRERARYGFDATMSRGPSALVAWLGLLTLAVIVVFSIAVLITGTNSGHSSVAGQLFDSLLHALDPGTVAGDTGSWGFLLTMLALTLVGLFIVSALIGVIATGIDARLMDLRKGRSRVLERDHTLILGFSDTVFTILSELAVANESRRRPAIVILAEEDKVLMEDAIREKAGDLRNTRVVCRTGSPIDLDDLEIASHRTARSIIVLSPPGGDADAEVIKTLLALTRGPQRRPEPYHIVAEIHDPANLEAARLVAGDEAVILDKRETIAKLIVQTARQSGASVVYTELFDFDGDEIYFDDEHGLAGRTYGDALLAYEDCSVIGLAGAGGGVRLNPPAETVIDGQAIVAVAEDDSRLRAAAPLSAGVDESAIVAAGPRAETPSRALMIGWNRRAPRVVAELDEYVHPGSELLIVTEHGDTALHHTPRNLSVDVRRAPTTDRATLDELGIANVDRIMVMCYSDDLDAQRADARTLVTLLHLRDILGDVPHQDRPTIISEMLDDRNRALAQVTEVDDVIVSDKIISLVLAQLSENPRLDEVFADLLDADGSEIYLRPAGDYVTLDHPLSFATVVEAARRRGETALGYRSAASAYDADAAYGVRVNPPKSLEIEPAAADRVIVLAED
jgi:voltage-gated potassium channel Kch